MGAWTRLWCRITRHHRGQVGFLLHSGAFWMCDHCGEVTR